MSAAACHGLTAAVAMNTLACVNGAYLAVFLSAAASTAAPDICYYYYYKRIVELW